VQVKTFPLKISLEDHFTRIFSAMECCAKLRRLLDGQRMRQQDCEQLKSELSTCSTQLDEHEEGKYPVLRLQLQEYSEQLEALGVHSSELQQNAKLVLSEPSEEPGWFQSALNKLEASKIVSSSTTLDAV
jgi:hypothetical protein